MPARVKRIRKNCKKCGKVFWVIPSHAHQMLCSAYCRTESDKTLERKPCPVCGTEFVVKKIYGVEQKTCSKKCRDTSRIGSHKKTSAKTTRVCEFCGNKFTSWPSRPSRFCGWECRTKYLRGNNATFYKGGKISRDCKNCGIEFRRYPSQMTLRNKFCSRSCANLYQRGKNYNNHTHKKYAKASASYRGNNWGIQRKKALERDGYKCRICGISESDLSPSHLNVHHKIPFNKFKNYILANRLRNLISLCPKDHRKIERVILSKLSSG